MKRPAVSLLKKVAHGLLTLQDRLRGQRMGYVFILAHMRSGSTLLNHLLMSHPEVLGLGERNAVYDGPETLSVLRLRVYAHHRNFLRPPRYVVDQINHDHLLKRAELLAYQDLRTIYLIRQPIASVASMVQVLGRYYGTTLEEAARYYVDRLSALSRYARGLSKGGSGVFVTYEDLVGRSDAVLQDLTSFLGLSSELSDQYQTFPFTGRRGDPGPNINRGGIRPPTESTPLEIPPDIESGIEQAYRDCLQTLSEHLIRAGRSSTSTRLDPEAGRSHPPTRSQL